MVRLDYEYRWYMITDRSLRIREGLLEVREQTMTFTNIQNVSIRQGPVQRLFGISDVEVRSAGGGGKAQEEVGDGKSDNLHIGYFRGLENAAEVKDAILAHLRKVRSAGLGDAEESRPSVAAAAGDPAEAARTLLAEARALRRTIERPSSGGAPS